MRNFTFIHIPKTGGSSVRAALGIRVTHRSIRARWRYEDLTGYYIFSFVRHPVRRFISAYYNFAETPPMEVNEFIHRLDEFPQWGRQLMFREQYKFLTDHQGDIAVDFVGKVENLPDDWTYVCEEIGMAGVELPEVNRSSYEFPLLEKDSVDILCDRYEEDLKLFSYNLWYPPCEDSNREP